MHQWDTARLAASRLYFQITISVHKYELGIPQVSGLYEGKCYNQGEQPVQRPCARELGPSIP